MNAVFFDLDETILDRTRSLERFLCWQARVQLSAEIANPEKFIARFVELDDHGSVWKDRVYEQLMHEFGIHEFSVDELLETYVTEFRKFCIARPHAVEAIKEIAAMGLKIGLVSNGLTPFQENNFEQLGISQLFDTVVVSAAVGFKKPDAAIFKYACEQLEVAASESIFVGDHPISDIEGAHAVGMYTVFVPSKRYPSCEYADAVCNDFRKLPDIVLDAK